MSKPSQFVHHITKFEQYSNLIKTSPCVVKFTAIWCGPCKRMAPLFDKAANENYDTANFIEIDIDSADEITNHENVQSIPLFLFYKDGAKRDNFTIKGQNIPGFEASVKSFINEVKMASLALDNVVDSDSTDEDEEPITIEQETPEYDSDENYNEYGEDCEIPIEKTVSEDMLKDSPMDE